MAKEKCCKCKKMKSGVKLRACDDRLCEECYEANEALLRKQRGGVSQHVAAAEIASAASAARNGKEKTARLSSSSLSSSTRGTRKNPSSVLAVDSDPELYSDNEATEPLRKTVAKLHNDIADLHEIIAAMRGEINDLKEQLEASKSDKAEVTAKPVQVGSTSANRPVNHDDVYSAVHKVIHDTDKRKRHVIVSGMVEDSLINDSAAFTNICEEHLNIKPAVASCARLGKRRANEPRRLLVRLYREDTVTELLKSARFLRKVDDPPRDPVVKNVYVNPDLAPAAAKLAYEERQRRRQRRSTTTASSGPASQHSSTENDGHLPTSNCNVNGREENGGESNNAVTDVQGVVDGNEYDPVNNNRDAKMQSTLNPDASPFPTTN